MSVEIINVDTEKCCMSMTVFSLYSDVTKEITSLIAECFDCKEEELVIFLPVTLYMKSLDGKVVSVGFANIASNITFLPEEYRKEDLVYLSSLCTHKLYRRRGFFREILNSIIENSSTKSLIIHLRPQEYNMENIYKSFGFNRVGEFEKNNIKYLILKN